MTSPPDHSDFSGTSSSGSPANRPDSASGPASTGSEASEPAVRTRSRRWALVKLMARLTILGLVGWGIWHTISGAREKFVEHAFQWTEVRPAWLAFAGAVYLLGMLPMCRFWHVTLQTLGQRPYWWETLPAFYIGHLGKYVPGKALVVYLRTWMLMGPRTDAVVVAASVFVETLTMMAVGACVSAVILMFYSEHWLLLGLAIALTLLAGVPTLPPIFRRLIRLLQLRRVSGQAEVAVEKLTMHLMIRGWIGMALGWLLMGFSLWATLQAMPGSPAAQESLRDLPLLTACVGLAMVAGFLSLLPGGLLVREFVVMTLLASQPQYGPVVAIVSAVLLRLAWLAAELVAAGVLYPLFFWRRRAELGAIPDHRSLAGNSP